MADMQGMQHMAAAEQGNTVRKFTNLAGAAVSLALIAGVGVWGYKIMVRDVSGVPVVRAAEGPMRVQPENPGGRQALNQGLAVNKVAAEGTAAKPADRLILAPRPLDLTLEDQPSDQMAQAATEEAEISPAAEAEEPPLTDPESVQLAAAEALATQLATGSPTFEDDNDDVAATAPDAEPEAEESQPATVSGGLGRSLRPQVRPVSLAKVEQVAAVAEPETQRNVDPESIPAGTRMAQLGAFESAEIAQKEWERLNGRFSEYLADKDRVVQKAQSGGRTFYRLRAMGFSDLSDARRFCSALVAENTDCIPVVTR